MLEQNPLVIKVKEIASQEKSNDVEGEVDMVSYRDGQVDLAREILDTLGIKY